MDRQFQAVAFILMHADAHVCIENAKRSQIYSLGRLQLVAHRWQKPALCDWLLFHGRLNNQRCARRDRPVRSRNTLSLGKSARISAAQLAPAGRPLLLLPLFLFVFHCRQVAAKVRHTPAGAVAAEDQRACFVACFAACGSFTGGTNKKKKHSRFVRWLRLSTGPIALRGPRGARAQKAVI